MTRWMTAAVAVGLLAVGVRPALGMGGNLDRPSIAIPVDPATKQSDPVVRALADVLMKHQKDFTGGSFLNSWSVLYFGGGPGGVKALVADLEKVKGATIQVERSSEPGVTRWMFPDKTPREARPCDARVEHIAWGGARSLHVTLYAGGGRVAPGKPPAIPAVIPSAQGVTRGRP